MRKIFLYINKTIKPIDDALSAIYHRKVFDVKIAKPIIIIGPERSGTTLLYSILSNHPDLYWFSRFDTIVPEAPFFSSYFRRCLSSLLFNQIVYRSIPKTISRSKGLLPPSECLSYWRLIFNWGTENNYIVDNDYFDENDLSKPKKVHIFKDIQKRLLFSNKKRLLIKQPGFALKIKYLNALFPDGIFLHIIRDPVDNIISLIKAKTQTNEKYWGTKVPGWRDFIYEKYAVQAAHQLKSILEIIESDIHKIYNYDKRYLAIKLEEIEKKPTEIIEKVLSFCSLNITPKIKQSINFITKEKKKTNLESLELPQELKEIIFDLQLKYGYVKKGL
jgi:LPS sulfotransferase NodH